MLDRFWTTTEWHAVATERLYTAPADPMRLVWVDPAQVNRFTGSLRLDVGLGRVQDGEWDRPEQCDAIRETETYRGLVQRLADGQDWESTALYERAKRRFAEAGQFRGYEDLEAFRETRCAYLDDLYESIRTEGYRPNVDAAHDNPATDDNPFEDAYANHLEPLVAIGRTGEVVWAEGYHRFAIADILDLGEIPVQVLCRHREWQRVRDAVAEPGGERAPQGVAIDPEHPDLRELEPGT